MTNSEKSIKILEFDKILDLLASLCSTAGAKKRALALTPSSNPDTVKKRLARTSDAKHMADIKGSPSFSGTPDILDAIAGVLEKIKSCLVYGNKTKWRIPHPQKIRPLLLDKRSKVHRCRNCC